MRVALAMPQYLCLKCAAVMYIARSKDARKLLLERHLASCYCLNKDCEQFEKTVFIRLDLVEST